MGQAATVNQVPTRSSTNHRVRLTADTRASGVQRAAVDDADAALRDEDHGAVRQERREQAHLEPEQARGEERVDIGRRHGGAGEDDQHQAGDDGTVGAGQLLEHGGARIDRAPRRNQPPVGPHRGAAADEQSGKVQETDPDRRGLMVA